MRRVTLVSGPPCAGKSTFVEQRRSVGDLVVDFDAEASTLGSGGKWKHTAAVGDATERRIQDLIETVAAMVDGTAWVIRCAPEAEAREALAARVRADRVIVLRPALGVLLERAARRPLVRETRRAIMRWLDRFTSTPRDELVR